MAQNISLDQDTLIEQLLNTVTYDIKIPDGKTPGQESTFSLSLAHT